jgi:hypothetical protein
MPEGGLCAQGPNGISTEQSGRAASARAAADFLVVLLADREVPDSGV